MDIIEFANLLAEEINNKASGVRASVSRTGKLIISSTVPGVKTGLDSFSIEDTVSGTPVVLASGTFSGGESSDKLILIGNEGDTYFQRWDSIKTLPGESAENQVVEMASVMLESHINLDGRTDKYRGSMKIASLDWSQVGALNRAYSQNDNYIISRELDEKYELDKYPSSILWTLPKAASADIDEWTHITLASAMTLDGDKGPVRALRRFKNSLISFQDKGIAEILFNSSTPISGDNGVPIEIANSGKVEGKRYLSGQYGSINKWSIVEGKTGLYFVDNINKAFCSVSTGDYGRTVVGDVSSRLGFSAWFKKKNALVLWTPEHNDEGFQNLVSFYDRIHSDIYLVGKSSDNEPAALVYNENIGAFTSFFDYDKIPMMTNIRNRFIAFKSGKLWKMHEGKFNTFFDTVYPSEVTYRVTPEPFNDKIWTNIDYRGDFFKAFDDEGNYQLPEGVSVNHMSDVAQEYFLPEKTFDKIKVWNEYQETSDDAKPVFEKKFRIWRYQIPRAIYTGSSRQSMDRIRNPWAYIKFTKSFTGEEETDMLMHIHDIVVRYFE